jgi:hypothetical protein
VIYEPKSISPDEYRDMEKLAKDMKLKKLEQELEKYKIAIKYFQDNGDQPTRDIIRNLLSY